jgi:hypothetical protein
MGYRPETRLGELLKLMHFNNKAHVTPENDLYEYTVRVKLGKPDSEVSACIHGVFRAKSFDEAIKLIDSAFGERLLLRQMVHKFDPLAKSEDSLVTQPQNKHYPPNRTRHRHHHDNNSNKNISKQQLHETCSSAFMIEKVFNAIACAEMLVSTFKFDPPKQNEERFNYENRSRYNHGWPSGNDYEDWKGFAGYC